MCQLGDGMGDRPSSRRTCTLWNRVRLSHPISYAFHRATKVRRCATGGGFEVIIRV